MKITNLLLAAEIVLTASCGFTASVTKKNYDDLSGNDDVVVDVDLSGISGGADTNAVNDLIGEYDRTNLTGRIDRKRDKTDLKVYRKVKDCWTWTNWNNLEEPLAREAPDDFLALANSPGSDPIFFRNGAWWGAVQFWPNGKVKYSQSDIPPAGTGEYSTTLNFAMFAYDETGTNELFRFGATARRTDPTNETVVAWNETRNEYVRIATTDMVDDSIRREVRASTNGLASVAYVDSATNGLRKVDGTARPLPRYLHSLRFDDSYPDDAAWYYRYVADPVGLCSARRVGNVLERNYDWLYDNASTFVIEMSEGPGRFASVGVASCGENISEDFVNSGKWSRFYKCLPGRTVDGVNSQGVAINVNVVVTNGVAEWEHHVPGDGMDIDSQWAVRFVLDNAPNAGWAASNLAERVYISPSTLKQGFSVHYAIIDRESTWLVEDGHAFRCSTNIDPVLTNFRLMNGSSISQFKKNDPYGSGYERYGILLNGNNSITQAWYTTAYRRDQNGNFPWPSEFAGETNALGHKIMCMETDELQAWAKANIPVGAPENFPRGAGTWQTVHTSIYDVSNLTLRVAVQENDDWYSFSLQGTGVDENKARKIAEDVVNGIKIEIPTSFPEPFSVTNKDGMADVSVNSEGVMIVTNKNGAYAEFKAGELTIRPKPTSSYDYKTDIGGSYGGIVQSVKMYGRSTVTTSILKGEIDFDYIEGDYDYSEHAGIYMDEGLYVEYYNDDGSECHAEFPNGSGTLAFKDDIPTVVSPTNDTSVSGKAADAQETGVALDGKLNKADLPTRWSIENVTNSNGVAVYSNEGIMLGNITKPNAPYFRKLGDTAEFGVAGGSSFAISPYNIITTIMDGGHYSRETIAWSGLLHKSEADLYYDSKGAAGSAETNAKNYADQKDSAVLNAAKQYADGKAQGAEDYADRQDAVTLQGAKDYVDGKKMTKLETVDGSRYIDGNGSVWETIGEQYTFKYTSIVTVMTKDDDTHWHGVFEELPIRITYEENDYTLEFYNEAAEDWFWLGNSGYYEPNTFPVYINNYTFDKTTSTDFHKTKEVAYTNDLENYVPTTRKINGQTLDHDLTIGGVQSGRYAMFIIPMNDTAYSPEAGHYTQFELKASTNNFEGAYDNRCCFYSHSGHADGEYSTNDRMHLFLNHGGAVDQRSYVRIPNTLDGMPDYAPSEVIVIVDPAMMNADRSDGSWLYEDNEDIVWTWVRTKDGERELDAGAMNSLWRPTAPVRWFSQLPAWAR